MSESASGSSSKRRVTSDELRRLAVGDVDAVERKRLNELLRHDDEAARQYRVLLEAERALAGGDVNAPGDVELGGSIETSAPRRVLAWRAVVGIVGIVGAVGVAAAALVISVRGAHRGVDGADGVLVEVFCVNGDVVVPVVKDGACAIGASLVVRLPVDRAGARLTLGFTDANGRDHLANDGGNAGGGVGSGVVGADGLGSVDIALGTDTAVGSGVLHIRSRGAGVDVSADRHISVARAR